MREIKTRWTGWIERPGGTAWGVDGGTLAELMQDLLKTAFFVTLWAGHWDVRVTVDRACERCLGRGTVDHAKKKWTKIICPECQGKGPHERVEFPIITSRQVQEGLEYIGFENGLAAVPTRVREVLHGLRQHGLASVQVRSEPRPSNSTEPTLDAGTVGGGAGGD